MTKISIPRDKWLHFSCCLVIAMLVSYFSVCIGGSVLVSCFSGFISSMCTGIGKEYGDKLAPGNKWDWYDILADFIGALIGCFTGFIPPVF